MIVSSRMLTSNNAHRYVAEYGFAEPVRGIPEPCQVIFGMVASR